MSGKSKGPSDSPSSSSKKESRKTIATLSGSSRDLAHGRTSSSSSSTAPSTPLSIPKDEDGLLYDQETGFIKAASVEKSVHMLTSQLQSGGFLNEFLMIYKLFLQPTEFLAKLIDKLKTAQADAVARLRVVNIVKTWIKEYPQDWLPSEALHQNLSAFIDSIKKDPELEKALAGIKIVLSKTSTITASNSGTSGPLSPSSGSQRSAPLTQLRIANQIKNLKELTSQELVEQLTLLDQELFDPVSPADFVVWTLQPQERENRAPKLMRFLERFSEIRNWVASTIVGEQEQSDRLDVISKFVAMAEHALDTGSFNLCAAVISGLSHPALNNLNGTWTALNKDTQATLDQVKSVCDPKDNYAALWSAMNLWRAPCVPFIGGLLERLHSIHKSNVSESVFTTATGAPGTERDLVNYAKMRPLLDCAAEIRPLRPTGIAFKPKQQIQTLFRKLHALDDDYIDVKATAFKESKVSNPAPFSLPIWLISIPPVERKTLASSTSLALQSPGSGGDSSRKTSGSVSSAAMKLEKRGSGKRPEKDTPKSPRTVGSTTSNGLPPLSPRENVPKLDMARATSSRSTASISPTAKLRPPSDDESSGATPTVPKPTAAPSIVSPRPKRTGSSTMLLQLQKLEPKSTTGTTASKPGTPVGTASPRANPSPRAPSPSGSSSPLGSSRDSTPPPEIPALPGMAVATPPVSKASSLKLASPAPAAATNAAASPAAAAPAAASEDPASPRALSPPPTPKEIESMLLDSPFESVEVIEQQLSPRVSRTDSAPAPASATPTIPIQRSASTAVSPSGPLSPSSSSNQLPRGTSVMQQRTVIPLPPTATKEDIRRAQIAAEIRDTEQSYVDFLDLLVKDGITPIRKGNVLPDADVKSIFSNIETIADFHKIFLGEINDIVKNWTVDASEIGSVFDKYHQYFKLYVEFVNNFDRSNSTLQKLLAKNSKLKDIQTALVKKSGKLDFGALLIMPIQRVPRYVLLLKDLRSRTAEDHPDFPHLQRAVKSVKDISLHINSSKKDAELNAKALELKKRLSGFDGELIKPGRRFIRETEASIVSSKGSTRVTVLFWNDFVMFCRPSDKKLSYIGSFGTGKLQLRTLTPKEMKKKLRSTKEPKDGVKHKYIVSLTFFDVEILLAFKTDQEMQQLLDDHKSAQLEMGARWFKKVSGGEGLPVPDVRDNVGHALVSKLNPSTGVYSNTWYIYGGSHKTIFYDDLWALDFEKAQWTRVDANAKGEKPGPRADHAMVVVGRRLFIWGGHNQGQFTRDVHIYNIDQNTWSCIPALPLGSHNAAPAARAGHSATVAEGRFILIFGGCHFENVSSQKVYDELWLFDTETYQWFPAPGQTGFVPPRTQHSCALLNGDHMVIYGGKGQENKDLNDMYSYDKNAGVWSSLSKVSGQVPSARSACGVAADDDGSRILLYGGGSVEDTYSDLYIFRARDSSWSLCSLPMDLPKRKSHAMVLVPDTTSTSSLAVFGGRIQNADGAMEYRNDVVIIKDIRKYLYGANADSIKQAKKLKEKCGKLASYSILKSGSSAKFESISASYNFVHRVHVDQDFRWDMAQNPLEVFEFDELIGRGGFGEVWKAKHKQSQFELAIKKVPAASGNFEKMSKEMEILKGLRHPSIVKYFGFVQVENENWIMMELCQLGSLRDMLKAAGKTLSEKQAAAVIASIVHGLAYLHQMNLLHRDIKSANILMGSRVDVAKLSDFGLADFASAQMSGSLSGSLPFMAPEVVKDRNYSDKSDVFALGITLIELLENTVPFNKLQRPKKFSAECNDFINQCLAQDPAKRPSAVQLGLHAFLAKAPVPSAELFKDVIDAAKKAKAKRPNGMIASPSSGSLGTASGATTNSGREIISVSSVGSGSNSNDRSASTVAPAAFEELKAENARLASRIDEQDAEIQQLKIVNTLLAERLAALEHHLGLVPHVDENNEASMPHEELIEPAQSVEMVETLHLSDLIHSTDSLLHIDTLAQ